MKLLFFTPILGLSALAPLTAPPTGGGDVAACQIAQATAEAQLAACEAARSTCEAQATSEAKAAAELAEARRALAEVRAAAETGGLRRVTSEVASAREAREACETAEACEAEAAALAEAGHYAFECDGGELAEHLRELPEKPEENGAGYSVSVVGSGESPCCSAGVAGTRACEGVVVGSVGGTVSSSAAGGASVRSRGEGTLGQRLRRRIQDVFDGEDSEPVHAFAFGVGAGSGDGEGDAPRVQRRRIVTIQRSGDGQAPQVLHLEQDGEGGVLRIGEGDDVKVLTLDGDDDVEVHRLDGGDGTIEVIVRSGDGEPQVLRLQGNGGKEGAHGVVIGKHALAPHAEHSFSTGRGHGGVFVWKDGEGKSFELDDLDDFDFDCGDLDDCDDLDVDFDDLVVDLDDLRGLEGLQELHLEGLENLQVDLGELGQGLHVLGGELNGKLHRHLQELHGGNGIHVVRPDRTEGGAQAFVLHPGSAKDGASRAPRVHVVRPDGGAVSGTRVRRDAADDEMQEMLDEMRSEVEALEAEIESLRRQIRDLDSAGAR